MTINFTRICFFRRLILLVLLALVTVNSVPASDDDLSRMGIKNFESRIKDPTVFGTMNSQEAENFIEDKLEQSREQVRKSFCDQFPKTIPCATLPNDNTDFSELFVYLFINATAQNSFDIFSWQSFIGMNWPVDHSGNPAVNLNADNAELRPAWLNYKTPRQLFSPQQHNSICPDTGEVGAPILETASFIQTSGYPLIDRNLNYVLYDVRINDELASYIVANGLDTLEGQIAFRDSGKEIDFPVGYYDDPMKKKGGSVGSAAVKSAWKIIDTGSGDDPSRYYTIKGRIPVSAKMSETGAPFCAEVELALVGMHIMRRTESGNGRQWTWSTFEHNDNSPVAANSRKPVDTLHENLFDGGCQAPQVGNRTYAFFNRDCENCATNHMQTADWKWSPQMPYAGSFALDKKFGTQVVRCWRIFEGTDLVNKVWQQKLQGTAWANYQLFSAQWKGANPGVMFPEGEVPRFLTNTTLETFDQYGTTSSCLSCHSGAKTLAGQDSAFSFILSMVAKFQPSANVARD